VRLASELTGWKIDLYSSREWLERGGEGPFFQALEPEDEFVADVQLNELKGLPADLVGALEATGRRTLRDVLDLELEDVLKIEGITAEQADALMTFLSELTEENIEAGQEREKAAGGEGEAAAEGETPK
jgi:N utilization substance protein A